MQYVRGCEREDSLEYASMEIKTGEREVSVNNAAIAEGNLTTWGRQGICQMIDWRKIHAKAGKSFVDPTSFPLQSQARD